jgi:hypothetical protein
MGKDWVCCRDCREVFNHTRGNNTNCSNCRIDICEDCIHEIDIKYDLRPMFSVWCGKITEYEDYCNCCNPQFNEIDCNGKYDDKNIVEYYVFAATDCLTSILGKETLKKEIEPLFNSDGYKLLSTHYTKNFYGGSENHPECLCSVIYCVELLNYQYTRSLCHGTDHFLERDQFLIDIGQKLDRLKEKEIKIRQRKKDLEQIKNIKKYNDELCENIKNAIDYYDNSVHVKSSSDKSRFKRKLEKIEKDAQQIKKLYNIEKEIN